jgi:ornithine cyclodeaminase
MLDMGTANAFRTAAADALAVDLLAAKGSSTLALFGGGHQAPYNARAIARVRPISRILVVARNPERAVAELQSHGLNATSASAEQACAEADVISTATTATVRDSPLFQAEWVRPGMHISAMGADGPGKRELPPELLGRATLFCDQIEQSRRLGEFQHAPATAALTTLGDVLTGRAPGRQDADAVTIFDSSGIGLQDLHLGLALLQKLGTT